MKRYILQSDIGINGNKIITLNGILRDETTKRKNLSFKIADSNLGEILERNKAYWFPYHQFREIGEDGVIVFDQLQPSYCDFCNRTHDNDNTLLFVIEEDGRLFRR